MKFESFWLSIADALLSDSGGDRDRGRVQISDLRIQGRESVRSWNSCTMDSALELVISFVARFIRLLMQFQRELEFDNEETLTFRPSMGLGLQLGSLLVDYAYTDLGDDQNTFSHVISLRLGLKPRNR